MIFPGDHRAQVVIHAGARDERDVHDYEADQRDHLDLQINLLSEREMTMVLQLLQRIAAQLHVHVSGEHMDELTAETSVEAVAQQISERLKGE